MTPKEKAIELTNKFYKYAHDGSNGSYYNNKIWTKNAKQCALIAVDEIRNFHDTLFFVTKGSLLDQYLDKVKIEIEKL
jgi:hypothetical protein